MGRAVIIEDFVMLGNTVPEPDQRRRNLGLPPCHHCGVATDQQPQVPSDPLRDVLFVRAPLLLRAVWRDRRPAQRLAVAHQGDRHRCLGAAVGQRLRRLPVGRIYRRLLGDEALFVAGTEMRVEGGLQMLENRDLRTVHVRHPDTGELVLVTRAGILEHAKADRRALEAAERHAGSKRGGTGA
jgi:hypothetical protein